MRHAKGLIAKKVGMTRVVASNGDIVPVTLLKVEDQKVTKIMTVERDGYQAIQVGFRIKADKNLTKADISRLRKSGVNESYAKFKEFRANPSDGGYEIGKSVTAKLFDGVGFIDVTGVTKGRGFAGAIKRWGSAGGRMSHGSMYHRRPGSLGNRATPARVFKNKKIPGCYGAEQVTVLNLAVMTVDVENNLIAVRGSVPGHRDGFLIIRPSAPSRRITAAAQAGK